MKKTIVRLVILIVACCIGNVAGAQNIYTLCGTPGVGGYTGDGSYASAAELQGPRGVAVDAAGNVYIADTRNNVVRKITTAGIISTFAGNNTVGYSGDGGPATVAQLNNPGDVTVDATGNVYIADTRNHAIRMVVPGGTISTIAGNGAFGYTGDGGPATAAQLNRPGGVGLDATGKLYIADTRNNVVRTIDGAGNISTVAGIGTAGYTGDAGAATAAELNRPADVAVDASNNIYIADNANNVVRMVSSTGTISTFAGTGTAGFSGDGGPATAAMLRATSGVTIGASGNVYISEASNAVRMVSGGTISTIAGNATAGYSGDGGLATAAQLNNPIGLALDASGNIYIGDAGNDLVRRIGTPVTGISITSNTGTAVCLGSTTNFTATVFAFSNPHYQWQVNGAASGTDSLGFTDGSLVAGDVINCILLDSVGNHVAVSGSLTVNTMPDAGTITGLTTLCTGTTVPARDSPMVMGSPGFWGLTDSTVATITATPPYRITGVTPGTDSAFFYRTNVCGSDTAWAVFTVTANIYAPITGASSVCANATTTYSDTPAGGGWTVRPPFAGTIDATGIFTAGMNPGTAYIIYGTNTCYIVDTITIDSLPVVDPIAGPVTVNMGSTITLTDPMTGGTWTSSDNTLATVGSATGIVTGVANGTVTITYSVTNANNCTGIATYDVYVDFPAGIANVKNTNGFSIYPNPATGKTTLQWSSNLTGTGTINVTDVTGRYVMTSSIDFTAGKRADINISSLKPGVYLMKVTSASGSYNNKLVVE